MEQLADPPLDIRDVVRRTGLSSRALRFYEARGLLQPLRTYSGRRLYGAGELERIHQIVALKRAGLSLARIAALTAQRPADLATIVEAQLASIAERQAALAEARSLLLTVKSRIDRGEPVDAATFCSLIRQQEKVMTTEQWDKVADRYFSAEERARWAERMEAVPGDFDPEQYNRQWAELGGRVAAAMPLGPDSAQARALYDEWQALLEPFTRVATPEMMQGATKLYERMGEWQGEVPNAPFSAEIFAFIQEVGRRKAAG
jgi:DNA-binding transcriptional MerR regulator